MIVWAHDTSVVSWLHSSVCTFRNSIAQFESPLSASPCRVADCCSCLLSHTAVVHTAVAISSAHPASPESAQISATERETATP